MNTTKKRDWGLVIMGVLLAICGIIFIFSPFFTLITLTIFAGAALLVAGIFDIITYIRFRKSMQVSGWVLAYAILDIVIGAMFLFQPIVMSVVLPWLVAIFFMAFGIFEIAGAIKGKKVGFRAWGWVLFSGIMSILVGIMLFTSPISFSILIGIFAIMRGITLAIYGSTIDNLLD